MTTPAPPDRPANSRARQLTTALVAAATLVTGAVLMRPSAVPPVASGPACAPNQQLVVMRAQDTSHAEVLGDTLFVQRTDTLLRVDESTHQAFAITLDSGVAVQMAAMCAPVDSAFRIRIVPTLPSAVETPAQQMAYAALATFADPP